MMLLIVAGCADDDNGGGSSNKKDSTAPIVLSSFPASGATSVALNTNIIARFSEAMKASTIAGTANFTLTGPGATPVVGTVSYDAVNFVADFLPAANLAASTLFTANITVSVEDLAGNNLLLPYSWTFTTGTTTDATAPTVVSVIPADMATSVPLNQLVTATFSETMDSATLTIASFTVMNGITPIAGDVSCPGTTATFAPSANLPPNASLTARITTAAKDLAGNPIAADFVWVFQTGTATAAGPAPVVLGTAANYVILAKSGVSTTGTTAVTGDIGLSPADQTFLTGFSETMDVTNVFSTSSVVTGQLFAADYAVPTPATLTTAILDMQTAYTDAAGRLLPDTTDLGAGSINGITFTPGLHKWGTGVNISGGITISGGANDVWIFQVAGTLTVGSGAIITLTGGAKAENIFWQVSGQATFGTTSDFKGIVLCQTAIVLQNGTIFNGRALAQTAVTLDATAITQP